MNLNPLLRSVLSGLILISSNSSGVSPKNKPQVQTSNPDRQLKMFEEFLQGYRVRFHGYEAKKQHKMVRVEGLPKLVDITYGGLARKGQMVSKFDGFKGNYHPLGSAVDFGLLSLLNNGSKQLIVEQTQWRAWAHWIVDLSSHHRVIFDGPKWGVGRELLYGDLDGDGVYEISQAVPAFVFFENLSNATSHLVDIVFKYDPQKGEYLPTNQIFAGKTLGPIESEAKNLNRSDQRSFGSQMLEIMLRYIYAGRKKEAWSFYDRAYPFADKVELKVKIEKTLKNEAVYRFIYSNTAS